MKIVSISLVRASNEDLFPFKERLLKSIQLLPTDTDFCVFPEYCWGDTKYQEIIEIIQEIRYIRLNTCFVFGSAAFKIDNGKTHNYAIVAIPNQDVQYIPKSNVLEGEIEKQHVFPGLNDKCFVHNGITFGVVICADLWDHSILRKLIIEEGAKLLLIPSLTVVPKGYGRYARIQWYSLGITRSREFIIPLAIADHSIGVDDLDVGNVTCVIDPSFKYPEMMSMEDFLIISDDHFVIADLDLSKIKEYRDYRIDKGIFKP